MCLVYVYIITEKYFLIYFNINNLKSYNVKWGK